MDGVGEQRATGRDTRSGETGVPGSGAYRGILKARAWTTPVIIAANVVVFGLMATAFNAVNVYRNPLRSRRIQAVVPPAGNEYKSATKTPIGPAPLIPSAPSHESTSV